jgi:amidase
MTELLLPHGGVLGLPTAPTPAPLLAADGTTDAGGPVRLRTVRLTCIASLAGLPAVSLPLGTVDGAPVGLCLLGRPGEDRSLLGFARAADALVPDRGPCDA